MEEKLQQHDDDDICFGYFVDVSVPISNFLVALLSDVILETIFILWNISLMVTFCWKCSKSFVLITVAVGVEKISCACVRFIKSVHLFFLFVVVILSGGLYFTPHKCWENLDCSSPTLINGITNSKAVVVVGNRQLLLILHYTKQLNNELLSHCVFLTKGCN